MMDHTPLDEMLAGLADSAGDQATAEAVILFGEAAKIATQAIRQALEQDPVPVIRSVMIDRDQARLFVDAAWSLAQEVVTGAHRRIGHMVADVKASRSAVGDSR